MTTAVTVYDANGARPLDDPGEISVVVKADDTVVWVDLIDPTDDELECLREEFELHPLAIEDAVKHGQRPKLEQYPTHAFLVAYSKDLAEVDLFVGRNWLISVRERNDEGQLWPLDAVGARIGRGGTVRLGQVVYTLLDELVDGYFEANDAFEDRVEAFEASILTDQLGDDGAVQTELLELRRRLVEFRRVVLPLRDVVVALRRGELAWVDETTALHLQDVADHVVRAIDGIDSQRELVSNAVDAHLAMMSNRMNQAMKRVTSWGAILLGSTLIAGIYGMNFEHMPELKWRFGYPFALGLMVVMTLLGYRVSKRRDWV
ncbi:MAG: magnesium/cobalt transporter CorA [Actinobacteria bacterium]|nr:magnesium/cobalt transporter CorA [Actinomycetota bacterium]